METSWWEKIKTIQDLVKAKQAHFQKEAKDSEEFLTGLVAEGTLSDHQCEASVRRLKVKGLKYEWEGFLSATGMTNRDMEDLIEKRTALNEATAKAIATVLECPKEVVAKVISGSVVTKGETPVVKEPKKDVKMDKEEVEVEIDEGEEASGKEEDSGAESEDASEEAEAGSNTEEDSAEAESSEVAVEEPPKKKRGRPPGSKNKAKSEKEATEEAKPEKPKKAAKEKTDTAKPAKPKEPSKEPRSKEEFANRYGGAKQPVSRRHALMNASTACSMMAAQWDRLKDVFEELAITLDEKAE